MHLTIIFHNIGGYHAARLQAAGNSLAKQDGKVSAIQIFQQTSEHPWGDLEMTQAYDVCSLFEHHARNPEDLSWGSAENKLLSEQLDQLAPDVVAVPGWGSPYARCALKWCRKNQVAAVLMSESKYDDMPRTMLKEWAKKKLYVSKFSAALVGGQSHKDYLIKLGTPRERIFLGYDVVDNDYFQVGAESAKKNPVAARQRQDLIPEQPFLLAATRFLPRKNLSLLVDSYGNYCEKVGKEKALHLVICGSGSEEQVIRNRIEALNLGSQVHLPGFVGYRDIVDWYGLAEAFIHPALVEQWGLVINEACASGLPILCSNRVGSCTELVVGSQNGFGFDPESVDSISNAMIRFHDLNTDERHLMGKKSQDIVADFHPNCFGEGMVNAVNISFSVSG